MFEAATKPAQPGFVWHPSEEFKRATNWSAFIRSETLSDYAMLERKAAQAPECVWDALIRFLDVRFSQPYERVLDLSKGVQWPEWCIGGRGNITLSLLDRQIEKGRGSHPAIVWEGEHGESRTLSYAELAAETNRIASGLAAMGLKAGDAVGLYFPMIPEVAIAYLALARLGCGDRKSVV